MRRDHRQACAAPAPRWRATSERRSRGELQLLIVPRAKAPCARATDRLFPGAFRARARLRGYAPAYDARADSQAQRASMCARAASAPGPALATSDRARDWPLGGIGADSCRRLLIPCVPHARRDQQADRPRPSAAKAVASFDVRARRHRAGTRACHAGPCARLALAGIISPRACPVPAATPPRPTSRPTASIVIVACALVSLIAVTTSTSSPLVGLIAVTTSTARSSCPRPQRPRTTESATPGRRAQGGRASARRAGLDLRAKPDWRCELGERAVLSVVRSRRSEVRSR